VADYSDDAWRKVIGINLRAVFHPSADLEQGNACRIGARKDAVRRRRREPKLLTQTRHAKWRVGSFASYM
jgi:hypothetical protein